MGLRSQKPAALMYIVVFALFGVLLLVYGHAAPGTLPLEAEAGTLNAKARILPLSGQDSNASGGKYLAFGGTVVNSVLPFRATANTDTLPGSLVFQDEFDGNSLNTANWATGWFENSSGISNPVQSRELQCYDKNMVSVNSGSLSLKAMSSDVLCPDGTTRHIRSGAVTSRDKVTYDHGYFEARIRNSFDSAVGQPGYLYNWPAFWTVTNNEDAWPAQGELDILEGSGGTADVNWHGPVSADNGKKIAEKTITNDWHIYAANWQAGVVTAYIDGVRVGSYASSGDVVSFQHCLNLMLQFNPNYPTHVPDEMLVDYVRVWQ